MLLMPLCTIQMQFLLFDREISYILKRIMELEANKGILLVSLNKTFNQAKAEGVNARTYTRQPVNIGVSEK